MDDKERQLMQMCGTAMRTFKLTQYCEIMNHFDWTFKRSENVIKMMSDLHLVYRDEDNDLKVNEDMWKVWESYNFSKNFLAYYKSDEIKKKRMCKGVTTEAQTFLDSFKSGKVKSDFEGDIDEDIFN